LEEIHQPRFADVSPGDFIQFTNIIVNFTEEMKSRVNGEDFSIGLEVANWTSPAFVNILSQQDRESFSHSMEKSPGLQTPSASPAPLDFVFKQKEEFQAEHPQQTTPLRTPKEDHRNQFEEERIKQIVQEQVQLQVMQHLENGRKKLKESNGLLRDDGQDWTAVAEEILKERRDMDSSSGSIELDGTGDRHLPSTGEEGLLKNLEELREQLLRKQELIDKLMSDLDKRTDALRKTSDELLDLKMKNHELMVCLIATSLAACLLTFFCVKQRRRTTS
jgi:hypothetical protein